MLADLSDPPRARRYPRPRSAGDEPGPCDEVLQGAGRAEEGVRRAGGEEDEARRDEAPAPRPRAPREEAVRDEGDGGPGRGRPDERPHLGDLAPVGSQDRDPEQAETDPASEERCDGNRGAGPDEEEDPEGDGPRIAAGQEKRHEKRQRSESEVERAALPRQDRGKALDIPQLPDELRRGLKPASRQVVQKETGVEREVRRRGGGAIGGRPPREERRRPPPRRAGRAARVFLVRTTRAP